MTTQHPTPVADPARLDAVRSTGLLDTPGEEAFDRLTRLAARVLDTPFAFVTLVDDRRSFWKSCFGVESDDPAERQNAVEESFCQYVVDSSEPLVVDDVTENPTTKDNPSIALMGVRAWAGYPITDEDGHVLGTMCAVDTRVRDWSEHDTEVLELLASSASNELRLRERVTRAASAAKQLGESLLPPVLPVVPGVDVAAVHRSASGRHAVLGDFYDLFRCSGGRWHTLIGDVCGTGTEAAKLASITRWAYQAGADRLQDPATILAAVNTVLLRQPDSRFVTAQAVTFDEPSAGVLRVRFASAGHHPAVVRRAGGGVELVEENGWVLGIFDPYELSSVEIELGPGDRLVLFTDGVIEARDGDDQFGHDRAVETIDSFPGDPYELSHHLAESALTHARAGSVDDVAVVVISPQHPSS